MVEVYNLSIDFDVAHVLSTAIYSREYIQNHRGTARKSYSAWQMDHSMVFVGDYYDGTTNIDFLLNGNERHGYISKKILRRGVPPYTYSIDLYFSVEVIKLIDYIKVSI